MCINTKNAQNHYPQAIDLTISFISVIEIQCVCRPIFRAANRMPNITRANNNLRTYLVIH